MTKARSRFARLLADLPITPEASCAYFPERSSCVRAFQWPGSIPAELFDWLLACGYRRCGDCYYRPECPGCRDCISYRLRPAVFRPRRSQRRVAHRDAGVRLCVGAPARTPEKEDIYLRYQAYQHAPPAAVLQEDPLGVMQCQMYTNPDLTREFELRTAENALMAFGTIDVAVRSVSAVYTVFDPHYARLSPGTLAVLRLVDWALAQGREFLYLGYYIPRHPKMDYKARFGPAEYLDPARERWQPAPIAGPAAPIRG